MEQHRQSLFRGFTNIGGGTLAIASGATGRTLPVPRKEEGDDSDLSHKPKRQLNHPEPSTHYRQNRKKYGDGQSNFRMSVFVEFP
ncbi:hypothetical protein ACFY4I_33960 [Streptomyces scabiei]|uniref:hypothetical protein n=1 Tax=Streptomyces scabiei TaxID=1930 RepID=UPI00369841A2